MIREGRYSKSPYGKMREERSRKAKEEKTKKLYNDRFCPYKTILLMERT